MTETQKQRFSDALARMAGDEEMLEVLAKIAVEDAPNLLALLSDHVKQGDCLEVARVGHALKGLLSTFETGEPVSDLQFMIDAARQGDVKSVRQIQADVEPKLGILMNEIEEVSQVSA